MSVPCELRNFACRRFQITFNVLLFHLKKEHKLSRDPSEGVNRFLLVCTPRKLFGNPGFPPFFHHPAPIIAPGVKDDYLCSDAI